MLTPYQWSPLICISIVIVVINNVSPANFSATVSMLHYRYIIICTTHVSTPPTITQNMKFSFIRNLFLSLIVTYSILLPEHGSKYPRRTRSKLPRGTPSRLPMKPPMQIRVRPLREALIFKTESKPRPIDYQKKPVSHKKHILPTPTLPQQIDSRQLFLRPRPPGFPFSLPVAFLIPAIPTLIG